MEATINHPTTSSIEVSEHQASKDDKHPHRSGRPRPSSLKVSQSIDVSSWKRRNSIQHRQAIPTSRLFAISENN
jgi:hypothetical protein